MAWRMNRNNSLSAKNLEYPVFTHNWFLPAVLITVIYTVLLRYWWDVSGGYDDELLPLEALSRVVPALALLCLFPFLQKHVSQTLPLAERRKLQMVTLGYLLLFCQESDWMTFIREPYLVGRVLFALFILGAWLALFITFATGPQDLLPSAHHSPKIWTLLFAMGCLIASQAIDLIFDASTYGYGWLNIELSREYSPLESMLELLFFLGMLHVTLEWLTEVEAHVAQRLFHGMFHYNIILAFLIGIAIGFTQWRHGEPAPLVEMMAGWLVAFGALGVYVWAGRRNGLL